MSQRGKNWTEDEDAALVAGYRAGRGLPSLAVEIGRPLRSVRHRAWVLRSSGELDRQLPRGTNTWTTEDDAKVVDGFQENCGLEALAVRLGRSIHAVRHRAIVLRRRGLIDTWMRREPKEKLARKRPKLPSTPTCSICDRRGHNAATCSDIFLLAGETIELGPQGKGTRCPRGCGAILWERDKPTHVCADQRERFGARVASVFEGTWAL